MAGRKLTRRQNWRIQKIQDERIERMRLKDAQLDDQQLGEPLQGLVIAHHGSRLQVEHPDGSHWSCRCRANLEALVTGDRVVWQAINLAPDDATALQPALTQKEDVQKEGVITALLPRHSVLARPDAHGRMRPMAANIDLMLIVIAPRPAISSELIDRYLVAATASGIAPVLFLNKTDLLDDSSQELLGWLHTYEQMGIQVLKGGAHSGEGLKTLHALLRERIAIFVGQSGVGKSSLVNTLLPNADQATNALSENSQLGRHTTSTALLLHFPEGGSLIDSPGIRAFGLWHVSPEQLLTGYDELQPLSGHCRFRNCRHEREPGCALQTAVAEGRVQPWRFSNYLKLRTALEEFGENRHE